MQLRPVLLGVGAVVLLAVVTVTLLWPRPGPTDAAFPGKNGQIVFQRNGSDIYVMNPSGSGQTLLKSAGGVDNEPSWSPNGERITYWATDNGPDVFVMDADTSNQENLTPLSSSNDDSPEWCSKTTIVFSSNRTGGGDIYSMDKDGSNPTRLTTDAAGEDDPTCSPDGSRIAFVRNPAGPDCDIWVMDADGSNEEDVSDNSSCDDNPNWSPDGTKIAFASNRDGDYEICVMDADDGGNQDCTLTTNSVFDSMPAWSPDGTKIVFVSDRDSNLEIYVMDADGGNQQNITNNAAADSQPDWQPLIPGEPLFLGPKAYLRFDDSPFATLNFSYFQLEDFEDGLLNVPGVSVNDGASAPPGTTTDSVDADDGIVDGLGRDGRSWVAGTATFLTFTFDENVLAQLPTHAGIVWTDVGHVSGVDSVTFEAFDGTGASLGSIGPVSVGIPPNTGETAEDRFFGVSNAAGISKIELASVGLPSTDWEVDHLQYGLADTDGDGCPDADENGLDETQGGQRDYKNPWDYFNPTNDGENRIDDVVAVIDHYRLDEGDEGYDAKYDRTLEGPNPWNTGPPDGKIRIDDVLNIIAQYRHDCGTGIVKPAPTPTVTPTPTITPTPTPS